MHQEAQCSVLAAIDQVSISASHATWLLWRVQFLTLGHAPAASGASSLTRAIVAHDQHMISIDVPPKLLTWVCYPPSLYWGNAEYGPVCSAFAELQR